MPASLLLLSLALSTASQQAGLPPPIEEGLVEWREVHGPTWHVILDAWGAKARTLYDGRATGVVQPDNDQERFELARLFVVEAWALFGVDIDTLLNDRVEILTLGTIGSGDKRSVRFRQEVQGVPVRGGTTHVLLDDQDRLVCIDSEALADASGFDVEPDVTPATAEALAALQYTWDNGSTPTFVGSAQLAITVHGLAGEPRGVLVWEVELQGSDGAASGVLYRVSAQGAPEVVERENLFADALQQGSGVLNKVRGKVTDGFGPDGGSNLSARPMPYVYVRNAAGQVVATTDANGQFSVPPSVTNVKLGFDGPYVDLCSHDLDCTLATCCEDEACANHVRTASLTWPGPNTVVVNPTYSPAVVAQANVSWALGKMRDWIRSVDMNDATFDGRAPYDVRPNRFFAGGISIADCGCNSKYVRAGPDAEHYIWWTRGGTHCTNQAFHVIIWHEMGHWMTERYGNGAVGGFGEGAADTWALYLSDQPILGGNTIPQLGTGNPIVVQRSGENTSTFCPEGDCPGGDDCYGEAHADGEVLMGAAWRVRSRLEVLVR